MRTQKMSPLRDFHIKKFKICKSQAKAKKIQLSPGETLY